MTIQRGRTTTSPPSRPQDKVGGLSSRNHLDTELVTLAELYRSLEASHRVRRDSVDIVYPSDNYSETPQSFPNVVLEISNDVEYVFPESYHPSQKTQYQVVVEPNLVDSKDFLFPLTTTPTPSQPQTSIQTQTLTSVPTSTVTQISTSTQIPTTHQTQTTTQAQPATSTQPLYNPTFAPPYLTSAPTPSISQRVTQLPGSGADSMPGSEIEFSTRDHPAASTDPGVNDVTENQISGEYTDYEDWGVVVSVVKSVSESDKKVTMIIPMTTEASTTVSSTHLSDETTKIEIVDETSTQIAPTKTVKTKPHPFLTTTNRPILVPPKNRTNQIKAINHKLHPFLNQIKQAKHKADHTPPAEGIRIVHLNSSEASTTAAEIKTTQPATPSTIPTTAASLPSLFGRFNFLNKKTARPVAKPASPTVASAATGGAANGPLPSTETSFLRSFKSRLQNRPAFKPFGSHSPAHNPTKAPLKKSFSKPSRSFSNRNQVAETVPTKSTPSKLTTTRKSLSRFNNIKRPSFKRKSFNRPNIQSVTRQPAHLVEKARTKRLPQAFSSLLKPRLSSRFRKTDTDNSQSEEDEDYEEVSPAPQGVQTVGEALAALQGKPVNDEPVTLRPRAFRPKSGAGSQIREKLHAELEAKHELEKQNRPSAEVDHATTIASTGPAAENLVLPTRLTGAGRGLRRRRPEPRRREQGLTGIRRGSVTSQPNTRNRLRVRPATTTLPPLDTTLPAVHILTEVDMMDKLGLTVVSSELPDTTVDRSLGPTDPPTQSPFQVLLESDPASDPDHEDHADHLASKHSPEIHLRLLHPDQPLEQPRSTADDLTNAPSVPFLPTLETPVPTDSFAPTLPNVSPTEGRIISSTTGAVSSTVTRTSPASTRGSSTETQPSTSSTASRGRGRARSRHRLQPAPTAASEPRQEAPRGSGRVSSRRVVRPRTRSRARLATGQKQETPEVAKEASEAASPRGRVTSPRRRLTRPRSSAPVFRSGPSSGPSSESPSGPRSGSRASSRSRPRSGTRSRSRVINQRLRIRGGARSTAAPVQVSQVDEIVAEGKVDNGVVTTERDVVTSEAPVVTINPTVVTTQESSLLTAEDPLVKAEDNVVKFEDDVVVTENFVATTEHMLLIPEESTFTTLNDFVDEKSQKPAEVNTESTAAAVMEDKGTDGPVEEVEAEIAVESHEEEISTLRPSKFKPKFGAETRNKLREKLQKQLEESKKKKASGGDVGITGPPTLTSLGNADEESDPFDSAFSDFDLTSSQQDLLTVKVVAPESRSGRQLAGGRSQLRSRGSERRHTEIRGSPRRRRLTQDYANVELQRVGRSTQDQTETQQVTNVEQAVEKGQGIFKDQHKE